MLIITLYFTSIKFYRVSIVRASPYIEEAYLLGILFALDMRKKEASDEYHFKNHVNCFSGFFI